jgi:hypothetical protein
VLLDGCGQGCQIVYFQTKNPNLGKFWRVFQWKMLLYFTAICFTPFGIFYGASAYFLVIWYIFHVFGILCRGKSSNPGYRKIPDEIRNFVEHLARRVLLPDLAVDPADQLHVVRICGY